MKKSAIIFALMNIVFSAVFLLGALATMPSQSFAQGTGSSIDFKLPNPLGSTSDLPTFISRIADAAVMLLTPVVVIMLLYTGFLFVTAHGNTEKLGEAKRALMYTLAGAALVLGAKGFSTVIKGTVTSLAK